MTDRSKDLRREQLGAVASFASGGLLLASAFMTALLGVSAMFINELIVIEPAWVFRLNVEIWGWIHIGLGVAMALVGLAVMFRWLWARVAAISVSLASMVLFFLWLPYYPVWSVVVIALNVVIIFAIVTWDTPAAQPSAD